MPGQLIQFAGSLLAILLLAWLARALRLGTTPVLHDDDEVRRHANQAVDGFDPVEIARDRDGHGAILRNASGILLLLKQHGAHFAGRIITPVMAASAQDDTLIVQTGERRFGDVALRVDNAPYWADAINTVSMRGDA